MPASLPNPFFLSALEPGRVAETAAGPDLADPPVPAADNFPRGFDPERFIADIEPSPVFLSSPRPEFLEAAEFAPVLSILSSHARRWPRASLLAASVWA